VRSQRPDFVILGAMKCGTSTLHAQLAAQPGFFMTEPKEPCFFSDDDVHARGLDWYRGLFAGAAESELRGESSTHYTKLPTHPRTVERLHAAVGQDVRFVYVMRHPVDRLVSHYVHAWTENEVRAPIDEAATRHPGLVDYGRYAMQLAPWIEQFGRERILPVFFERMTAKPQEELERICAFLGYAGKPVWRQDVGERNVSSERLRRSPLRDAVINVPPLRWARRTLVPKGWRDAVKGLWTMRGRPELSPSTRRELEATFDDDLAILGTWLGVNLSCSRFREVALGPPISWTGAQEARSS
jgi:hypothetical protein